MKQCVCLFDGKVLAESQLLDAPEPVEKSGKNKKQNKQQADSEERMKTMNVQILIPEVLVLQPKQQSRHCF